MKMDKFVTSCFVLFLAKNKIELLDISCYLYADWLCVPYNKLGPSQGLYRLNRFPKNSSKKFATLGYTVASATQQIVEFELTCTFSQAWCANSALKTCFFPFFSAVRITRFFHTNASF